MNAMTVEDVRRMLLAVAEKIVASEEFLCQADREIGDGDHGVGMAKGFGAARDVLLKEAFTGVHQVFATVGRTLIKTMGGASGIVFGLLFYAGTKGREDKETMALADLAGLLERAQAEIMGKGGAKVGDKTMLDALDPMVRALRASAARKETLALGLKEAAAAAEEGMEASKGLVARFGKAKALGERAIGYPDAGAVSLTLIGRAMAEWAAQNS